MARIRTKRFEKQGISRERYRELLHFSRQYREIRQRGAADQLAWRVPVIERAAMLADEFLAPYILESVTAGRTYEQITAPCGRSQFFQARRLYFGELDRILKEVEYAGKTEGMGRELQEGTEV